MNIITGWFVALVTAAYLCAHSRCCFGENPTVTHPEVESVHVNEIDQIQPMMDVPPEGDNETVDELNALDGLYQ